MIRAAAFGLLLASASAAADTGWGLSLLNRGQLNGAYRELKESAEAGDVVAARALGSLLERGMSVPGGQTLAPRPEEAAKWYRQAAEAGDKHSANMMGVLCSAGLGVPRDPEEALRWFERGDGVGKALAEAPADVPEAERREIAAWQRAVDVTLWRDVRFPRGAASRNSWGDVELEFDAATRQVAAVKTDAIALIVNQTETFARRAFLSAPPPPAAVRHRIKYRSTITYRITRD